MNADLLETQLVAYLSLREALGFQTRAEKILLPEFVTYVKAHESTGPMRTQMALAWACQVSAHRGAGGAARRLSMARGFMRYLKASVPDTEVPESGLLPTPRRPQPYLFTPPQLTALFEAAQGSRPRDALRPHTLSTLIGLLASTGLRVGEAIRLRADQVKLELHPPQLHILETKFYKSRLVPLHPSTAERLRHYGVQRARLGYDGLSAAFFVSEKGQHLQYLALHNWFARLCQRLALQSTDGGRNPCLMSFRHTFAVTCMQRWYQQDLDVQALLPHLSVYLGHVDPQESYWYLTAMPEL
jgi:integrase/recombinase XerD